MEAKEVNNIKVYGKQYHEISYDDKFKIVTELYNFAKGTIKGSYIPNELYLIPDSNKGIYRACSNNENKYLICDLEKENNEYICHNIITLKEYVENQDNAATIEVFKRKINMTFYTDAIKKTEGFYKDNYNNYYEIKFDGDKTGSIYLENKNKREFIDIRSNYCGTEIEFNDIKLGYAGDRVEQRRSILESILEYVMLNKNLFNDFKKLKGGYIWNNEYYENYEDILYDIEQKIKSKNLENKFMTEGLTLDDFSDEKS